MIVDELFVELGVEVDTSAVSKAKEFFDRITGFFGSIPPGATIAAGAIAGIGAAIFGVASQVEKADAIGDFADKLGVSGQELQAWQHAANMADVEVGAFNSSLEKLTKRVGEALSGSEEAKKALNGIQLQDSNGKTRDSLAIYKDLVKTISALPGPAERSAALIDVFGREGQNVLSLFNQEAGVTLDTIQRFQDSGWGFDAEALKNADLADKALKELRATVEQIMVALFGNANAMLGFKKIVDGVAKILKGTVLPAARAIGWVLGIVMRVVGEIIDGLGNILEIFGPFVDIILALGGAFLFLMSSYALVAEAAVISAATTIAAWGPVFLAFALWFLVLEDIAGFFQGKKSLTGNLVNAFKQIDWSTLWHDIGTLSATAFVEAFSGPLMWLIKKLPGGKAVAEDLAAFVKNSQAQGLSTVDAVNAGFSGGAASPVAAQALSTNNSSNASIVSAPVINFNGANMSPEQMQSVARDTVKDLLNDVHSSAKANLSRKPGP